MKITMILPSLSGGGAERSAINLATGFVARGIQVEMLLLQAAGVLFEQLPPETNVTVYHRSRALFSLFDLRRYFRSHQPDVVITFLNQANLIALWAHRLAGSTVPIIPTVRSDIDRRIRDSFKERVIIGLTRLVIGRAARVIGVSEGVSESIRNHLSSTNVETIYNPTVVPSMLEKAHGIAPHAWFQQADSHVVVAAGRLVSAKGYDVLIAAFARVREQLSAKLIIIGEGPLRNELEALIIDLKVEDDVALPGFVTNPYVYFSHADLFVLSSRYEGLPNALIEAMACGTPVVATDCHSGPREILVDGQYGSLVPVDDIAALAEAMVTTLTTPPDREAIQARAMDFSLDHSVEHFLGVIEAVCQ
jgi:glycosyltransferase involved in cell wall biosynthesis